jgi:hypothetical protein
MENAILGTRWKSSSRFEAGQSDLAIPRHHTKMSKLIFRCVRTGMSVQVWLPETAPTDSDNANSYEAVTCPACARMHLVNKTTGRTLSDTEK